jgi:hypothetical protein
VLVHHNYKCDVPQSKLPSFFFEVEPGFVFPPEVAVEGRTAHLEKLIKDQGSVSVGSYWCSLFMDLAKDVKSHFEDPSLPIGGSGSNVPVSELLNLKILNRRIRSLRRRRCH